MSDDKAHSPLGASVAQRNLNCYGAVNLIKQAPTPAASLFAAEGTVAHIVAEKKLLQHLGRCDDAPQLGDQLEADGFVFTVDEEMLDAAEVYVSTITEIAEEYGIKAAYIKAETPIHIPSLVTNDLWGRTDSSLYAPYKAIISVDFKYGAGRKVDVDNNEQLKFYLLGEFYKLSEFERDNLEFAEAVIIQPRMADGIQRARVEIKELLAFKKELEKMAAESAKSDAPRCAGEWCYYCPAKMICPEHDQYLKDECMADFSDIEPTVPAKREIVVLSDERVLGVIRNLDLLKQFIKDIEAEALRRAYDSDNKEFGEFELCSNYKREAWTPEAMKQIQDWLFDQEEISEVTRRTLNELLYTPQKLITPKQMEAVLKKHKIIWPLREFVKAPEISSTSLKKKVPGNHRIDSKSDFDEVEPNE